jgi:hypothetical protein
MEWKGVAAQLLVYAKEGQRGAFDGAPYPCSLMSSCPIPGPNASPTAGKRPVGRTCMDAMDAMDAIDASPLATAH